jgi:hypothetical protein
VKKHFFHQNGLSIVLLSLFLACLVAQSLTGWHEELHELERHGEAPVDLLAYLGSGGFLEVTMENWESEFLQMYIYVLFTVFLYQRGSAESKDPDKTEAVDRDPRRAKDKTHAPSPVRAGGWRLRLYEQSLGLAFLALFIVSFVLHAVGGTSSYNEEQLQHGEQAVSVMEYLGTSRFWFESFQNWQSEFLAIGSMVVLSIFLRQRGSPESKPVDAPHSQTGSE